jgi:hypothetical protein
MGRATFDRYSIVHAAWGALSERVGLSAPVAIGASAAFEVSENAIKREIEWIWPDPTPDSIDNHLGDITSFTAGYFASRALRVYPDVRVGLLTGLATVGMMIWLHGYSKPRGET